MIFIILMILTTLAIAGSAAFFSVYGLGHVFIGAFWSVVLMGGSLEAGKLMAASYLYRFWNKTSIALKVGLFASIFGLMCITSMGIFGYLSNAYQDNVGPMEQQNQQLESLQTDKDNVEKLKAERLARQEEINKQIANLPPNFVNGRNKLMAANKDELDQIKKDVADYTASILADNTKIAELKNQQIKETAHVGPIIFIAKVFGADVNQATKWLILLIIGVFDPLAVMLTIGTNIALREYKEKVPEVTPQPIPLDDDQQSSLDHMRKKKEVIEKLRQAQP